MRSTRTGRGTRSRPIPSPRQTVAVGLAVLVPLNAFFLAPPSYYVPVTCYLLGMHTALPPTSAQVHFSSSQRFCISSDAPSLSHPCPHECTPARRHDRPPRPTFLPDGKLLLMPQERRTTLINMTRRPRGARRPCQRQWPSQSRRAARADTVFKLSPLSPSLSSLSSPLFLLLRMPLLSEVGPGEPT